MSPINDIFRTEEAFQFFLGVKILTGPMGHRLAVDAVSLAFRLVTASADLHVYLLFLVFGFTRRQKGSMLGSVFGWAPGH